MVYHRAGHHGGDLFDVFAGALAAKQDGRTHTPLKFTENLQESEIFCVMGLTFSQKWAIISKLLQNRIIGV